MHTAAHTCGHDVDHSSDALLSSAAACPNFYFYFLFFSQAFVGKRLSVDEAFDVGSHVVELQSGAPTTTATTAAAAPVSAGGVRSNAVLRAPTATTTSASTVATDNNNNNNNRAVVSSGPKRSLKEVLAMLTAAPPPAAAANTAAKRSRDAAPDEEENALDAVALPDELEDSRPSKLTATRNARFSLDDGDDNVRPVKHSSLKDARVTKPSVAKETGGPTVRFSAADGDYRTGPMRFPSREQWQAEGSERMLRTCIPEKFASVQHYVDVYSRAVRETINLQLLRIADSVYGAAGDTRDFEQKLRSARLEIYSRCSLLTREWRGQGGRLNVSLRLELPQQWHLRSKGEHQKDDLWAISFNGTFSDVFIVRSVFHGVSRDGSLAVELLPHQSSSIAARPRSDSTVVNSSFKGQSSVWALRLVSAATELQELGALASFGDRDPLVNAIVNPVRSVRIAEPKEFPPPLCVEPAEIEGIAREIAYNFRLNTEQTEVLMRVAGWFGAGSSREKGSVVLVHGVFGSGKSTLLVAIVIFLVELMDRSELNSGLAPASSTQASSTVDAEDDAESGAGMKRRKRALRTRPPPFRVAIAAATNTAVDRVLEGLLAIGHKDILRVGSLKKMSRKILPYTLYEEEKDAIHELKRQLKDDELSAAERFDLEKEVEELTSGRAAKRKERLGVCPVLGTTCSASSFKLFKDHSFDVLMLDESSQMIEPLSLLPIKAFLPNRLIAVGDPNQLAPPLPTEGAGGRDLSLTLFSRLAPLHVPVLLRTQYRCHPHIAGLASNLFYQGQLVSGVSEQQRAAVLNFIQEPLLFVDSAGMGSDVKDNTGSYCNALHTNLAVHVLKRVAAEWPNAEGLAQRCGVITLFRAQARHVRSALSRIPQLASVRVSTVDAFQGAEQDVVVVVACRGAGDAAATSQFVSDVRRLNVTLTRARYHCIIVGDAAMRTASHEWGEIIRACKVVDAASLFMEG